MTSKTSLFNCGIYKATVRRYIWGAVFYAIVLFMLSSIPILFSVNPDTYHRTMAEHGALILGDIYFFAPLIISFFVPTIVALLVYRFVHSKKTSVFIHSLPVSRRANYISSVLGAMTLMLAPIVINGIILIIMSVTAYGAFFDVTSCLMWIGFNALSVILMFSTASLAAFLTGNSFAMVGINALLHSITIIIMGSISSMADVFLYGFNDTNFLINAVTEWNFIAYITGLSNRISYVSDIRIPFDWVKFVIMLVAAGASYFAAFWLYKKRRLETAEDVAAYKCMNPIYKYLITALSALGAFALFGYTLEDNSYLVVIITLVVSAVVYFAAEMILKKSFRIWKSYKGYLTFLIAFAVFTYLFAFTGFFGFETRVPDVEDVSGVMVNENYALSGEAYVEDEAIIGYAKAVHDELVKKENIYTIKTYLNERNQYLTFKYKLKNGRVMTRRYPVSEEMLCRVLDAMYKSDEYKRKSLEIFKENIVDIHTIEFETKTVSDDADELFECIRADVLELDYSQMHCDEEWTVSVHIQYLDNTVKNEEEKPRAIKYTHQRINANFKRTVKWFVDHGYADSIFNGQGYDLTVLTSEQWKRYNNKEKDAVETAAGIKEVTVESYVTPTIDAIPGAVRISDKETKGKLRNYVLNTPIRYVPKKEYSHYVCIVDNEGYVTAIAAFYDGGELMKIAG